MFVLLLIGFTSHTSPTGSIFVGLCTVPNCRKSHAAELAQLQGNSVIAEAVLVQGFRSPNPRLN